MKEETPLHYRTSMAIQAAQATRVNGAGWSCTADRTSSVTSGPGEQVF